MVLPSITINSINDNKLYCTFQPSKWVGENWVGYFFELDGTFYYGRFSNIDLENKTCSFTLEDNKNANLEQGQLFYYLDGYYGDMAELVLNKKHNWTKRVFLAEDSVEVRKGVFRKRTIDDTDESITVSAGWDHEHCSFCMATIGNYGVPTGYQNQDDEWVCRDCYKKYIEKCDLSFIPESKNEE